MLQVSEYLEKVSKRLNIQTQEDWYSIQRSDIKLQGSLSKALALVYPQYEWQLWRFYHLRPGYWRNYGTQKKYFDWLAESYSIATQQDWYTVTQGDILATGGGHLLRFQYNGSLAKALANVYPQYDWKPWKFSMVSQGFWKNRSIHRKYFDWISEELMIETQEDWYGVRYKDITERGGVAVLQQFYGDSHITALKEIYPQFEWFTWKFKTVPSGYWNQPQHQRKYFDWVADQLGVTERSNWYNLVSEDVINRVGFKVMYLHKNSLIKTLSAVYPEHTWNAYRFRSFPKGYWKDPSHYWVSSISSSINYLRNLFYFKIIQNLC